jgi:hypothetical protein
VTTQSRAAARRMFGGRDRERANKDGQGYGSTIPPDVAGPLAAVVAMVIIVVVMIAGGSVEVAHGPCVCVPLAASAKQTH